MTKLAGRRVLFIQHAGALGGSAYSLLYTMQGLRDRGYVPEVALVRPSGSLRKFYTEARFKVHDAPDIGIFAHTTGGFARVSSPASCTQFVQQVVRWSRSKRATLDLVARVLPDIVHLNSVVLLPSAQVLRRARIPHVWHVRECPPRQGWRTRYIRRELLRHPEVIFLSQHDRHEWTRTETHGTVIPNFVNFAQFDAAMERNAARSQLGFSPDTPLVLFVGGTTAIKGFAVLIEAVSAVKARFPKVVFAMPGAAIYPSRSWPARAARATLPLLGWGTAGQRVMNRIAQLGIGESVQMLPFAKNIVPWLAACDLLVFPSIEPHFARPVIEAGAMSRPVVGSDIGGVRELVVHGETGLLSPPGDTVRLAEAILAVLGDGEQARYMGEAGRKRASALYNLEKNIMDVCECYQRALHAA